MSQTNGSGGPLFPNTPDPKKNSDHEKSINSQYIDDSAGNEDKYDFFDRSKRRRANKDIKLDMQSSVSEVHQKNADSDNPPSDSLKSVQQMLSDYGPGLQTRENAQRSPECIVTLTQAKRKLKIEKAEDAHNEPSKEPSKKGSRRSTKMYAKKKADIKPSKSIPSEAHIHGTSKRPSRTSGERLTKYSREEQHKPITRSSSKANNCKIPVSSLLNASERKSSPAPWSARYSYE